MSSYLAIISARPFEVAALVLVCLPIALGIFVAIVCLILEAATPRKDGKPLMMYDAGNDWRLNDPEYMGSPIEEDQVTRVVELER